MDVLITKAKYWYSNKMSTYKEITDTNIWNNWETNGSNFKSVKHIV